jgi:hypothetical protein
MLAIPSLRRTIRRVGALLLASIVCLGAFHTAWDDPFCDPVPVHHNHNAHRMRAGRLPAPNDEHCILCHSLRSLGTGLVAAAVTLSTPSAAGVVRLAEAVLDGRVSSSTAASRAPPLSLL